MHNTYIILESFNPQAISLKKLLEKELKAELLSTNGIQYNDSITGIRIPTGAKSTYHYVQQHGDLKLGEIVFSKRNLITYDKVKMLEIVNALNIPVPRFFSSKDEIAHFPVFYKSAWEHKGKHRGLIYNKTQLSKIKSEGTIFQEFINNQQSIGLAFLAKEGKILTSFCQIEILCNPSTGGTGIVLEKYTSDKIEHYTEIILQEIGYSGWGLAEFKYCPVRKDYIFMEINAKFWSSLEFTLLNNPAFAKMLFGIEIPAKSTERIVYLNQVVISELKQIMKSFKYLFSSKCVWQQNLGYIYYQRFINKFKSLNKT